MKRKSFEYKGLMFFERNKEDMDFSGISERYKKHNFRFIQEYTDDNDDKLALLGMEMHKEYSAKELSFFMNFDMVEVKLSLWHSHSFAEGADQQKMLKVVEGEEKQVMSLLLKLEAPKEVKKKAVDKN